MDPSMAVETPTTGMNGITRDLSRDLNREVPYKGLVTSAQGLSSQSLSNQNLSNQNLSNERNMAAGINSPNLNSSDNLFVANLQAVSLEKLVKSKLEVLFQQQRDANIELSGLYDIVLEQVEKPLIELALQSRNGNQVKTAQLLGINRNTLKKKIDSYKIRIKRSSQRDQ